MKYMVGTETMSGGAVLPSMRGSKLKASEAALLAGELQKPSWESRNEGIHERVSFEDSIWGFDLAGGLFYKTPLRVTAVKNESRAQKAGIRPGDKLLRINDIDTSTLTIQEAHAIIIESGIHIRLAVSAPEDTEDSYGCWQDQIEQFYDPEAEKRLEEEKAARRRIHARTNANWSLQWPWVSKRRIIYKESNCYMVPSKYENNHRDKFSEEIQGPKAQDDIVLHSKTSNTPTSEKKELEFPKVDQKTNSEKATNGIDVKQNNERTKNGMLQQPISPIPEETSDIEGNNEERIKQNVYNNKDKAVEEEILKEVQEDPVVADELKNEVEESQEKVESLANGDDLELEDWEPTDNDNSMEVDTTEEILDEMLNGQETIEEEEQNKLLEDVLNEISEQNQRAPVGSGENET